MIEIDGSEGGGQVVRTAVALSALAGEPVEVTDVRGGRPEPGLGHQHLTAVRTLARIADAELEGDELGSERIVFDPGEVSGGHYEADIGTAGSVTLLFDAALPLAVATPEPIAVTATGGTDVKWSPTMAYYRRAKLPLLRRHGLLAAVDLERSGFYPKGGGAARLTLGPSRVELDLTERGSLRGGRVYSKATHGLAEDDVDRRQASVVADRLEATGVTVLERETAAVAARCPGSAVAVALDYEHTVAGFDALGEPGKPAEAVGEEAVAAALSFEAGTAAVDRHMADQVLPFVGVGGGRVLVPEVTDHVRTSLSLLSAFDRGVETEAVEGGTLITGE